MSNDHLTPRDTILQPGDDAPDFTLLDQDRNEWHLADAVKTGDVVLCFYPLAFTSVCADEMTCVTNELDRVKDLGSTIIGISCDSFAANKAWAEQAGIRQPLLADMHRQVCKAYGSYWPDLNVASRGTVVIGQNADGKGKVRWSQSREPGSAMDFATVVSHVSK